MSFILESLKKSDQQRRQGELPRLDLPEEEKALAGRKRSGWLILLTAVLLANACLLVYFLFARPMVPAPVPAAPPPPPATATVSLPVEIPELPVPRLRPAPAAEGWESLPAAPGPEPRTQAPATAARRSPPSRAPERPAVNTGRGAEAGIPTFADLPPEFRQRLPGLNVSLHFFTEEAGARMARINGRILREGDEVVPGLTLDEITPSALVLRQGDLRFTLGEY